MGKRRRSFRELCPPWGEIEKALHPKRRSGIACLALTPELAHAVGLDAGNRSMRRAGRTCWNDDDATAAAVETNRLLYELADPSLRQAMADAGLVPTADKGRLGA